MALCLGEKKIKKSSDRETVNTELLQTTLFMYCWITGLQWVYNSIYNSIPHNFIHTLFFLNTVQAIRISDANFEIGDRLGGQISEIPGLFNIKPGCYWLQLVWKFLKLCWQCKMEKPLPLWPKEPELLWGLRILNQRINCNIRFLLPMFKSWHTYEDCPKFPLHHTSSAVSHFSLEFQYLRNTSEMITQKMLKASSSLHLETSRRGT